jgi:hypothetical protein
MIRERWSERKGQRERDDQTREIIKRGEIEKGKRDDQREMDDRGERREGQRKREWWCFYAHNSYKHNSLHTQPQCSSFRRLQLVFILPDDAITNDPLTHQMILGKVISWLI